MVGLIRRPAALRRAGCPTIIVAAVLASATGPTVVIASAGQDPILMRRGAQSATPASDLRDALLRADDARVATAEQRQAVEQGLASPRPEIHAHALRVAARTRRAEFLPTAIAALTNSSIDVRREAAFAVAHIGSGAPDAFTPAERALREALGSETDTLVCAALAEEYGRLPFPTSGEVDGAARVLHALLARLGSGGQAPPFVALGVARSAEALARRAARLQTTGAGELPGNVVTLLDGLYTSPQAPRPAQVGSLAARIRRLAMTGLVTLGRVKAGQLQLALADDDEQVRRLGVIALTRGPVTLEQALGLLTDRAVMVRHAVASKLGPALPPIAEAATKDAHANVRTAAIDALGAASACRSACTSRLATPEAFGDNWREAAHALVALAHTDPDGARAHVNAASAASTWQVRMYAARAAALTRQAEIITRLASDPDVNVRHAALVAWRETGQPGLTAAATSALASDDGQLVLEAALAIREAGVGRRETGGGRRETGGGAVDADAITTLRAALARLSAQRRETSRDPRVALIELLAEVDPDAATTLRPYLADFDPFIGERVATLLNVAAPRAATAVPHAPVPSWADVETMNRTLVALRLRNGRALRLRLYAENAPTAAARLLRQIRAGEWKEGTFHRVEPGFVVQGGSPAANEYAGAADFARDEFSALSHVRGTVGISTRGTDTGDGQIFINLVDNARLDFAYTIVGSIVGDASLIDDIAEGEVIESALAVVQPPEP